MAILHGTWITSEYNNHLFIWGEMWRAMASVAPPKDRGISSHPLAMTQAEFTKFLGLHNLAIGKFTATSGESNSGSRKVNQPKNSSQWQEQIIALPTQPAAKGTAAYPLLSSKISATDIDSPPLVLELWRVEGLCLTPLEAVKFLQALPLGSFKASDAYVGSELRFWSQICRWSLDLLTRCKFLPGVYRKSNGDVVACWEPLLDSATDQARLAKFIQIMPSACRAYLRLGSGAADVRMGSGNLELVKESKFKSDSPQELLISFLSSIIDVQVRCWLESVSLPVAESPVSEWLQSLSKSSTLLTGEATAIARLETALSTWKLPIQQHLIASKSQKVGQNLFRTCFILQPPESGESNWKLNYSLQAVDNADFLVDAKTIWDLPVERLEYRGRSIELPQETFLKGLGLASRLYPPIEPSLHDRSPHFCSLTPVEVYEFIRGSAWRLSDSGLGIILPPGLAPGAGATRLGISLSAELAKPNKKERLGLKSLLNFKWELAIGDQTISKKEFDRLMALKSPLVEVNGEWIALQPSDVRAAQAIFATSQDQMNLSVEDALRLSTGDTTTLGKLPVVKFEASGALQELITNLTGNQSIVPIEIPASFRGELRPYQVRGVSWLAFLEKWGLGACLADDMGLGKCVASDTEIPVNGLIIKAENIWKHYAGETEFDGEGFWSYPNESLIVNSLDEKTGKITQAPIRRLYRQRVREKLRIIKLKDGNSITITYRHKLLTNRGWTNDLHVGDYVSVPAKMIWNGQSEDPDLVKFLAWQIAEGYEKSDLGYLGIAQKNKAQEEYRQRKPSKWTTQTLEAYAQLDKQKLDATRQDLQYLLDREVFYCQIEEIEEIEYDGWVYDFEVSQHHNFVANNIICHNTIQTIVFLLHLKKEEALESPTLLVCPTSVLGNWEREVQKFAPTLKVMIHHGDKRLKGKSFARAVKDKELVVTSYPLVYRDAATLQDITWQGIILDEAQNIKNPGAKQSKAIREINSQFHIALTGTPVENRLTELWSILDFLNPGYLGDRSFFQRRFAMPIEKFGDTDSLKTLRSLVQPFILRRMKTDKTIIQDLPDKQEMTVFCGLSAEQASLYQKLVDESIIEIESADGIKRKGLILTLLLRLKQVCNHPAQYLKEKQLVEAKRSGKLLRLQEMLEEAIAEGDSALIFTQFAEWGKLLQGYLQKELGSEILFLYGSTKKEQREEMVDRFQNDPEGPQILILSLKAGGTGLNLTKANHVFHVDRWWNPAVENQATDRAFRIGQTRNVQVHKFVCTGTLEEKINDLIESKKQLAEQTVEAGENWVTEMDTDQLRSLLLLDRNAVIDED